MRKRTSILNDYDSVKNAIDESNSIRGCLEILGLRSAGGNYDAFKKTCVRFALTCPIMDPKEKIHQAHRKNKIPIEDILVEHSTYNRGHLKKRLIRDGYILPICSLCGLGLIWNNLPLSLQLDHINGIHDDNRIENLRLLCPNCHSQTSTFCKRS